MVRFFSKEDYYRVLENGPWILLGHYLFVSKWRPNFRPFLEEISSTLVWILLAELSVEFFNDELLMRVGNKVEKVVRVDDTTILATRGRYTRVCVEVNLKEPWCLW